jgi:hypothetical protein
VKLIKVKQLEEERNSLKEKERLQSKDKKRLKEIEEEILPLKTFLEDAQKQRDALKKEIGMYFFIFII